MIIDLTAMAKAEMEAAGDAPKSAPSWVASIHALP